MTYIERYKRYMTGRLETNTIDKYISDISLFMQYIKEKNNLINEIELIKSVTPVNVEDYFYEKKSNKGILYSINSINKKIFALKGFFQYLIDVHGVIEKNPFSGQKKFKQGLDKNRPVKKNRKTITLDEMRRLIQVTQIRQKGDRNFLFNSRRNRLIIALISSTGMRIEELLSIKLNDIEKIDDMGYIIQLKEDNVKCDTARRVPIGGCVMRYYEEYIELRKKMYSKENLLIISSNCKKIDPKDSRKMIDKYLKISGIEKKIDNHCLRHSYRTVTTGLSYNENLICGIGGWSLSNMAETYFHCNDKSLDKEKIKLVNFL